MEIKNNNINLTEINNDPRPVANKVKAIPIQLPSAPITGKELVNRTLSDWTALNFNRSKHTEQRKQEKIASIHSLVKELAEKEGIDPKRIEEALAENSNYTEPALLLDSYRMCYFPELEEFLLALGTSDQINSRLRL
jgi:hypothetical protein